MTSLFSVFVVHTTDDVYVTYKIISVLIFWSLENSVLKVS